MARQNILVIGSGGREHALAWKIRQSPDAGDIYIAPGNGGTSDVATNVDIATTDVTKLLQFARDHDIYLTVVGPDDVLAAGCVDAFKAVGLRAYGPTQGAARIEASKAYSKDLMQRQKVPTASYKTFTDPARARKYVKSQPLPIVVKASGLALGKGVYICGTTNEALAAIDEVMTDKKFGSAGMEVVIEQYLDGREVSLHAFCDGKTAVLFPPSQDHKRIGVGDTGPNTGGMGTYAPVPWVTHRLMQKAQKRAVEPILAGLAADRHSFSGTLYPGLMVQNDIIYVLEYNARFGDPETQSYMRILDSDLLSILNACVDGTLADQIITWSPLSVVTVILASAGYPGTYSKNLPITGINEAQKLDGVKVFHAGTAIKSGRLVTSGGRVLAVTATGRTLDDAKKLAYQAAEIIDFKGKYYRTDISDKAFQS